jgi:hypothetical protein
VLAGVRVFLFLSLDFNNNRIKKRPAKVKGII